MYSVPTIYTALVSFAGQPKREQHASDATFDDAAGTTVRANTTADAAGLHAPTTNGWRRSHAVAPWHAYATTLPAGLPNVPGNATSGSSSSSSCGSPTSSPACRDIIPITSNLLSKT